MTISPEKTTHFGTQNVAWDEKQSMVRGVFDSVASRYDLMNDLMSFGLHRWWKKEMLDALPRHTGLRLLDLAGGTGDIALAFQERMMRDKKTGHVTICDINAAMLTEGRNRAIDRNMLSGIEWACGNAEALPFADRNFDAATIAFGIRNVTDIPKALTEIHRVLKPGGKFICLEFTPHLTSPRKRGEDGGGSVSRETCQTLYDTYSYNVIPKMGKLVTGDNAPYQYLVESIRQFPPQEAFEQMLRDAGFSQTGYRNLTGGVVALHHGWRV